MTGQEVGASCDCGDIVVLCMQCGVDTRCLTCSPYWRPSSSDLELYRAVRDTRAQPVLGLMVGLLMAMVPTAMIWANISFAPPGTCRTLSTWAGSVAVTAFLIGGALFRQIPLPDERPSCQLERPAPAALWLDGACAAVVVEALFLVSALTPP